MVFYLTQLIAAIVILSVSWTTGVMNGNPTAFILGVVLCIAVATLQFGGQSVLKLRGWNSLADRDAYGHWDASPWAVAFKGRAAVERWFADAALRGGRPKPEDWVYDWYGDDVVDAFRSVVRFRARHGSIHETPEDVLTAIAEGQVSDYNLVLERCKSVPLRVALYSVKEDIPLEYARGVYA